MIPFTLAPLDSVSIDTPHGIIVFVVMPDEGGNTIVGVQAPEGLTVRRHVCPQRHERIEPSRN